MVPSRPDLAAVPAGRALLSGQGMNFLESDRESDLRDDRPSRLSAVRLQ